ncbi:hypothetical protein QOZ83_00030 [Romboutsia sedimentorum]|uniref:hypothetical protein n=1 Tax=Romboutsia sedimentorum TaxID=1368474 RepID=UPI0024DEF897|nr:hypothetical protein [Romboutsia sedimentorum]MDK2584232.1 hypothetical protein [Romboutsia sedimentorum]
MYINWNLIEMRLKEKKISFKECAKMLGIGTVTFNRYRTSVSDISVKLMYDLLKIVDLTWDDVISDTEISTTQMIKELEKSMKYIQDLQDKLKESIESGEHGTVKGFTLKK